MTDDNTTHHVNESAQPITLKTNVKRGEGTRDQDKVTVKVKGDDPEETVRDLRDTLDALEDYAVAYQLRATQPGESDE